MPFYKEYDNYHIVNISEAIKNFVKNKKLNIEYVNKKILLKSKSSDTLFILGSGPSINSVTNTQWDYIKKHDTFGLNLFCLKEFPTTYYYLGYEPSSNDEIYSCLNDNDNIRLILSESILFLPTKVIYRMYHPKIVPEIFPACPKIHLFRYPKSYISIYNDTDNFSKEMFNKTILYRGTMSLGLYFADKLEYKNIVMMGVDLHSFKHFYDDNSSLIKFRSSAYNNIKPNSTFEDLLPKNASKQKSLYEYYTSLNEIYLIVKPLQVSRNTLFLSKYKITEDEVINNFLTIIFLFFGLFVLSGILSFEEISFKNSFTLSILTITNTVNSSNYNLSDFHFLDLSTFSKISLISFMVIGRVELLSFLILIKKFILK